MAKIEPAGNLAGLRKFLAGFGYFDLVTLYPTVFVKANRTESEWPTKTNLKIRCLAKPWPRGQAKT